MKGKLLLVIAIVIVIGAGAAVYFLRNSETPSTLVSEEATTEQSATTPSPETAKEEGKMSAYDLSVDSEGLSKAVATITLENGGVIKWRFYSNDAPNTVKRIAQLISEGFYDGIVFHRVVPGFVVQAGDPTGTGSGGSGVKLKAEFNSRKHEEGIVSMARTADPNSADSQFFIMLGKHPHLDGQYTVIGKVVEGFDHVQKIKQGDKIKSFTIQ